MSDRDCTTARQGAEKAMLNEARAGIDNRACREFTIGELFDRKIEAAERAVRELRDMKANLPGAYLASGVSRVGGILPL